MSAASIRNCSRVGRGGETAVLFPAAAHCARRRDEARSEKVRRRYLKDGWPCPARIAA